MQRVAIKEIERWFNSKNRLPLIVKGARQVGKTYLIKDFISKNKITAHIFNFEKDKNLHRIFKKDLFINRILEELSFRSGKGIGSEDLIFFDEIQECPEAISSLKYFAEERPELPVIAAGSLLGVALNESSYPVGKVTYLWLGPLSFEEYLLAVDDDLGLNALAKVRSTLQITDTANSHLLENLKKFYITGGLPRPILELQGTKQFDQSTIESIRNIQGNILRDYLNDFSKHSAPANALHLRALFESIPEQLARVNDGNTKKFKFGDAIAGKKGFSQLQTPITWLDKAGLVYKISIANRSEHPLKAFCKENFFKLYIFDIGILSVLLNLPAEAILSQDYGMTKGYFAESLVLQGLVKNDLSLPISWIEGQSEIEFLTVIKGEIVPIEVKSGTRTKAKSLDSYINRYKPKAAVKLYSGMPSYHKDKRLHLLPLYLAWNIEELPLL